MKQYLLSIYQPDGGTPPPEILESVMQDVNALVQETKAAGVWVFNGGLHPPSTATVVRLQRGDVLITDGPFAEGKEHIGGFVIIKGPDLDSKCVRDDGPPDNAMALIALTVLLAGSVPTFRATRLDPASVLRE